MKNNVHAILNQIREDYEKEAEEVLIESQKENEKEIENELNAISSDIENRKDKFIRSKESSLKVSIERKESRIHRQYLSYKRELLEEIFAEAVNKLDNMPKEDFYNFCQAELKKANLKGDFEFRLGEFTKDLLTNEDLIKISEKLPDMNISISDKIVGKKGGFVLLDDNIVYNFLFEDIVEDKKISDVAMVAQEVFPDV